jgi:hypothetical protein
LTIDTELLLFKAFDGGVDDFGGEFVRGHVSRGASVLSLSGQFYRIWAGRLPR